MAVETLVEPRIHDGDGATVDFAAPRVLAAADIVVSLTNADGTTAAQTLGVDYSLIGSVAAGYTVRFTTAPAVGVTVAIERDTPPTQPSRFKDLKIFPAARTEGAFDRGAESVQDLRVKLARALLAPPGEDGAPIPGAASRANRLAAYDGAGAPVIGPFTSLIEGLLNLNSDAEDWGLVNEGVDEVVDWGSVA